MVSTKTLLLKHYYRRQGKYPLFQGKTAFPFSQNNRNTNTKNNKNKENKKVLGPSEVALSSVFLFFVVLLLLLSSLRMSCLFLGCMFLSLLVISSCFLSFFDFCCFHPCCPLLMYSLFVFVSIVPTFPCSLSSFSYFLFLFFLSLFLPFSPFVYVLFQHDTTQRKTQKPDFVFDWQNRAGFSEFQNNDILWENIALCCRVQTNLGKSAFSNFQIHNFVNLVNINFQRPHNQPFKQGNTQPKKPYFYSVCYLHLYMKTQLLEIISNRGVKNGPFFRPPTCMLRNTITRTHIFRDTAEHSWNRPKTSQIPIITVRNWRG